MSSLTRWNPFREMENLHDRLSTLLRPHRGDGSDESLTASEWTPLVDIVEDDQEYVIKAELPEMKRDDIKVTVENGHLSISGERKFEKEEKGKKYHRVECSYGKFIRSFELPDNADPERVNAEFKEGMLRVHVAKSETAQPKHIQVNVA